MKEPQTKYWCYSHIKKWFEIDRPYTDSLDDISDLLEKLDFLKIPDITLGDELDFLCMYEHPHKDLYLFHLSFDDFRKIIFADNLPSMLIVLEQLNLLVNSRLKTMMILDEMKEM